MKGSSLGAIALAASLATGTTLADQKKISEMTREEIRAEVKSVCENPERMKNIIDPDNVCEYSLDNGKTWREYIPSMPTLPNGTAKIAGGGLGALLLLLGTGAAIMRYRKKDKKNDPQAKFLSALKEATDKGAQYKGKSNITASRPIQEEIVEPTIKTEQIKISTDGASGGFTTDSLASPVIAHSIEGGLDGTNEAPETTGDWDEVERILAAENAKNTSSVDAPGAVDPKIDITIQDIPNNKGSEANEPPLTPTIESEISSTPINAPGSNDVLENAVTEDEIKEKLRSTELSDEEKIYISKTSLSILQMVKTNIEKRYGFKIDDTDAKISLTAITDGAKLFHLDDESIVEKQNFSTDGVAQFRRLGEGYFQIVYTTGKTQNIYLVKGDN